MLKQLYMLIGCTLFVAFPFLRLGPLDEKTELSLLKTEYQSLSEEILTVGKRFDQLLRDIQDPDLRLIDAANVNEGRLTTESGVPLSTSDRSNQSTLYYTPYMGANISVYSGSIWKINTFTEISLALSGLTANRNYDVFIYDNSGTLTLELSAAWNVDNITRTDALTLQDGVYVKSSDTTRRYLGTIRVTSATQTQDTQTQRFVWNYQNQLQRDLYVTDGTNTWTYAVDSWRQANGSAANAFEYVSGLDTTLLEARSLAIITNGTGTLNYYSTGIGIDSTSTNSASLRGSGSNNNMVNQCWGEYRGYPGQGFHTINWLERGHASTITVWGDNGDNTRYRSGMIGEING